MINITEHKDCCGCWACVQRCPKQCISMKSDSEGFFYPFIDKDLCVSCGLCVKVCPVKNKIEPPICTRSCFASYNNNEIIRKCSSSGGIASLISELIISKGGFVFGAVFNKDWEVEHVAVNEKEDICKLRGSKYVQSQIKNSFIEAEKLLKNKNIVLFIGTPCQIAGLHLFLKKKYSTLYTMDFICHGVPSPGVWKRYLSEIKTDQMAVARNGVVIQSLMSKTSIKDIRFRDKSEGWKDYRFVIEFAKPSEEDASIISRSINQGRFENEFMAAFLRNYILRPSCYDCPVKEGRSCSDITICDFWGIEKIDPKENDDKGVSGVIINSVMGEQLYSEISNFVTDVPVELNKIIAYNKSYNDSCKMPQFRKYYFRRFKRGHDKLKDLLEPTVMEKLLMLIERKIGKIRK